ncbi:MAG: hypothetical protein IMZ67_09125 [Acidobacteria bacterium]|nr:hypothetical protein [Acidobacteriota bacterium]
MTERSPEDVAAGILRIAIEGTVREVPTLKAKYVGEWGNLFGGVGGADEAIGEWTMADVSQFSTRSIESLIDLIVAYDRSGALGGREWLEEHADPGQLHEALVQMVGNAFPLADPGTLVDLTIARAAVASARASSTNGASRSGTSTRTKSAHVSTRSR